MGRATTIALSLYII